MILPPFYNPPQSIGENYSVPIEEAKVSDPDAEIERLRRTVEFVANHISDRRTSDGEVRSLIHNHPTIFDLITKQSR